MNINKRQKKIGNVMLLIVISLYLLTALWAPKSCLEALQSSFDVLKTILPILVVVLFLMAFFNSFIQSKKISRYLGKKSGLKGWAIAVVGGLLSHGPGYVWYPILSDLRANGVKDGLIIAFFYARAIKIPWLPMMASYFGIAFTIILTLFILLAAFLQGLIADRLISHSN